MKNYLWIILLSIAVSQVRSFSYDNHGSDWTSQCATGVSQSPINIEQYTLSDQPTCLDVNFSFLGNIQSLTTNNGHTLVTQGQYLQIDFKNEYNVKSSYRAIQFHFHSSSEHTIDGEHFDLELHIVTKNVIQNPTKLAVFGIFFTVTDNEAEQTPFFKKYQFPTQEETNSISTQYQLDFASIFNLVFRNENKLFIYQGSLTTPTCNEYVNWHVIKKPLKISRESFEKFKELWFNQNGEIKDGNNRITMPLNGRKVQYVKFCSSFALAFSISLLFVIQIFMF